MSNVNTSTPSSSSYLKDLQEQLEDEIHTARQKTTAERKRLEQKNTEQASRLEKRFLSATEKMRSEQEAAATREKNNSRAELARLKSELYTPVRRSTTSEHEIRAQAVDSIHEAEEQFRKLSSEKDRELSSRTERAHVAATERAEKSAQALRASHEREVNDLANRLAYAKSEYDRDTEAQREQAQRASSAKAKNTQEHLEELARSHSDRLKDVHSDHLERERALEKDFTTQQKLLTQSSKKDKEYQAQRAEQVSRTLSEQFEKAENSRTDTFLDSMKRQDKTATSEIQDLKSQLHELKTTASFKNISPDAERNLRDQVASEYSEQSKRRESEIQARQQENLSRAKNRYDELRSQYDRERTQLAQKLSVAETQGRLALSRQSIESQLDKDAQIAFKSEGFDRMAQNLERHYQKQLEAQRQSFEDRIAELKIDSDLKTDELRQEAEFQLRMERRSSAARQNELIRDYEKRLSDQREDSSEELRLNKATADKTVIELEQRHRRELDQMINLHERRLAGFEQQYQERERVTAKNHQEQIEKLKRTHALLISKKS